MAELAEGARLLSECGGKLPPRVRIPVSPPFVPQSPVICRALRFSETNLPLCETTNSRFRVYGRSNLPRKRNPPRSPFRKGGRIFPPPPASGSHETSIGLLRKRFRSARQPPSSLRHSFSRSPAPRQTAWIALKRHFVPGLKTCRKDRRWIWPKFLLLKINFFPDQTGCPLASGRGSCET